jgi:hypothetical protein
VMTPIHRSSTVVLSAMSTHDADASDGGWERRKSERCRQLHGTRHGWKALDDASAARHVAEMDDLL